MSTPEDITGEEEPSEEELAALGLSLHYIHMMEGPRWHHTFDFGPIAGFEFLEDFTKHMMEKYPQWFQFLTPHDEDIDSKLFLNEGIQELVYDDSVKEFLSNFPDLPKISILGQRPAQNCKMYLAPNIPTKKLKNGISNDRFRVNGLFKETDVFTMIDENTLIFAAKNGLMITNIGIFWRSTYGEYGGLPWRINDSSMTGVMHVDGLGGTKDFAVVIDEDLILPIGGLGAVYEPEADVIAALMSAMMEIAEEQHNSSR
jgi:hypothetical protein